MTDSASELDRSRFDDELLAVDAELVAVVDGVSIVEVSVSPTGGAENPVAFRLLAGLPEAASFEDVDVDDDRDEGHWRRRPDEHALQFEAVASPDETLAARYGVGPVDDLDPEEAMRAIDVEIARPAPADAAADGPPLFRHTAGQPLASTTELPPEGTDAVTPVDETMFETPAPGETDETSALAPDHGERVDGEDADGGGDLTAEDESTGDEHIIGDEGPPDGEVLVDALVGALERGDLDEEQRRAVRSTLGVERERSTKAHVRHLQGRVEEVLAYTDALEEFIDEEGTAAQLLEELRSDLERLTVRQETLENGLDETDDRVGQTHGRVVDVEADVESLDDEVTDLWNGLGSVRGDVDTLERDVEAVEDALEEVLERQEEDLSAFEDEVFHLQDVYEQDIDQLEAVLRGRISDVEESLEADIERVEEKHDDEVDELKSLIDSSVESLESRQDDLEEDVDEIENDVDDLDAWRSSFMSAVDRMRPE